MHKCVILPLAKQDILEAALWYNKCSSGLGRRFTAEVREKIRFIRKNPLASNVRYDGVRTSVLSIFSYMLHYSVDEVDKTIIISAVFHTRRDPELWERR